MDLYLDYESPVGHLLLSCGETGLTGIWMNRPPQGGGSPHPTLLQAAQWLDGYFFAMAHSPKTVRSSSCGSSPCWMLWPSAAGRQFH